MLKFGLKCKLIFHLFKLNTIVNGGCKYHILNILKFPTSTGKMGVHFPVSEFWHTATRKVQEFLWKYWEIIREF